jgi:hypothetical protein
VDVLIDLIDLLAEFAQRGCVNGLLHAVVLMAGRAGNKTPLLILQRRRSYGTVSIYDFGRCGGNRHGG